MLKLSEIWVYPVKSLGGISLQEAQVTDRGLELDRRWLLVDDDNRFLTQREYPQLALFRPEIIEGNLKIVHKELLEWIIVPFCLDVERKNDTIKVVVWDDTIDAFEVSSEISNWFSKIVGFSARLVYMPDESKRKVDPDYAISGEEITSFADAYPFLIIGQSSLDDLNSRLDEKVSMNRFRPNFVFTNGAAFEEDFWRNFKIGNVPFAGVKRCDRCVMTTVDQEKGVVSSKDPLKTLAKFRNFGNKVLFGQNLIGLGVGTVSVGDEINVLDKDR